MEIIEFIANLFLLEDSKSTGILFKIMKVLLMLILSFMLWTKVLGGVIILPTNPSDYLISFWHYIFSGAVLIPLILISIVLLTIKFTEAVILPILLYLIALIFFYPIKKTLQKMSKKYERPMKIILNVGVKIGFMKIKRNKIVKGFLYPIYQVYIEKFDINQVEKTHIKAFCLIAEILLIWFFLIMKIEEFALKPFLYAVFYFLIFLLIYIPLNISFHKAVFTYKDVFVSLDEITKLKHPKTTNDNNTNS